MEDWLLANPFQICMASQFIGEYGYPFSIAMQNIHFLLGITPFSQERKNS